jgi:hypothetical protein
VRISPERYGFTWRASDRPTVRVQDRETAPTERDRYRTRRIAQRRSTPDESSFEEVRTGLCPGGNRIRTIGPAEGARHRLGVGSRSPTFPWRGPPRGSRFGRMMPEPHTIGAGRLSCCLSPGIGNGKHEPQPGPPLPPQGGASGLDAYLGSRRECESDQPERDGHVCYDFILHCRDGGRVRRGWRPTGKRGRSS